MFKRNKNRNNKTSNTLIIHASGDGLHSRLIDYIPDEQKKYIFIISQASELQKRNLRAEDFDKIIFFASNSDAYWKQFFADHIVNSDYTSNHLFYALNRLNGLSVLVLTKKDPNLDLFVPKFTKKLDIKK